MSCYRYHIKQEMRLLVKINNNNKKKPLYLYSVLYRGVQPVAQDGYECLLTQNHKLT